MSLTDITDVIDRVTYWIYKSDAKVPLKIAAAYHQKGGWEGWAQVEIAYLIEDKYPHVTIDREVNVYTGTLKENDFVVTDKTDAHKPKQVVELKCERGTQTASQFKKSFMGDVAKIRTLPIDAAYKPAKAYAVAITCTKASYDLLKGSQAEWAAAGISVSWIQASGEIWIWWYEKDIV